MKARLTFLLTALLLAMTSAQIASTAPKEIPSLAGNCMKCLLSNATQDYCFSSKKCYDGRLPSGSGCTIVNRDILEDQACGRTVTHFSGSAQEIPLEKTRITNCPVDD